MQYPEVLKLGERVTCLPVLNGSADFAWEIRRLMLEQPFDCLALPLPESFRDSVELGIERLPHPTIVVQRYFQFGAATFEDDEADD